ncbi:hypothetical protein [Rhizobium leguminosarum]|uniref:hypothetical protein n=1 Tax=Rhizobium leguminosarum TaxID=384 RepID=UPI00103095F9|nr:hypothetical protein [Rhizobium leguminosarum]TAV74725.1 hypothetical protein ELI28_14855 [Rhizobium leguminosarum]TAV79324.1 hypothetical protein ELI27_14845 [Rhizobium leguminosarum]
MSKQLVEKTLELLGTWANSLTEFKPQAIYTLGSLVYLDGAQFGEKSDVDLIVVLPEIPDALDRVRWLEGFLKSKIVLEDELGKLLRRDRKELICSVVAVTSLEIYADLHKDGAAGFFSNNRLLDLITGKSTVGLPGAGSSLIAERLVKECVRQTQKMRNSFLAVNALGDHKTLPFDDADDAAPKPIMRHAAMVQRLEDEGDDNPGAEYDVDIGADRITVLLHERRKSLPDLTRRFASRRKGRMAPEALSSVDQLTLIELIFDAVIQVEAKPVIPPTQELPALNGVKSTVFFGQRFSDAFPGVRGIQWFDNPSEINQRLKMLLGAPLEFKDDTPVWWTRGNSNLAISTFRDLGNCYLINFDELAVTRVAASNVGSYKYNFVYIEVEPLQPTGLYESTPSRILEVEQDEGPFTYYSEEYAIVDGEHLVTRSVYDDGSAFIGGKLQSIKGRAELRGRYVTKYNFIIAAGGASLLDQSYDSLLEEHLDAMLKGEDRLKEIAGEIVRLPTGRF